MLKKLITVTLAILAIGALWVFAVDNWSAVAELEITMPVAVIPVIALAVVNVFSTGMVLEVALIPHGIKITTKEVVALATITRFSNNIAPGYLGAAIRALYFKQKHNLAISRFSSSFVVSNLVQLAATGLLVAWGIGANISAGSVSVLYLVAAGVFAVAIALFAPLSWLMSTIAALRRRKDLKVFERFHDALKGYELLRTNRQLLLKLLLWTGLVLATSVSILYFLYLSFGVGPALADLVLIAALGSWGIVFSITPGNIGIREGLMVFGAQLTGVPLAETLAASLLLRVVVVALTGAMSLYFTPRLMGRSLASLLRNHDKGSSSVSE